MSHLPKFGALILMASSLTAATPASPIDQIIKDHWSWFLAHNPVYASRLGVAGFGKQLGDISLAEADRQAESAAAFVKRLNTVPDAELTLSDRANKGILSRLLSEQVEANGFGQRMMLFTTYSSWHQNFADLGTSLRFQTRSDFEDYLARLNAYPAYNGEAIRITQAAVKGGYTLPCAVLGGFERTITGAIAGPVRETRFFAPFREPRPNSIPEADWTQLKSRAETTIARAVVPEFTKFASYFRTDYLPKCRKTVGAFALPQGRAWYASQVRSHTTTELSPDAIHKIGLAEVARITQRMESVARAAGFSSRAAMVAKLRSDPAYYAKSTSELVAAASTTAKLIDGKMPGYFGTLPRLPYGVRTIPAETAEGTTTAYYSPGSPASGLAGNYYVNTSKLDQRPLFELPALTAHEAVPGHHHQIALQQELELPEFRKHLAGFTAFVEGWGLYAEYLGEEMGLYDTPEKMMGRLSYEMWRACRLVVDTGIHEKGWSKDQAVAFMRDNTALSAANIDAEVNRYISWPGQALGYKLGEIKIRELRARAEAALGDKFELPAFHDAVLMQGAVPLDVLERQIDTWIAAEKGRW